MHNIIVNTKKIIDYLISLVTNSNSSISNSNSIKTNTDSLVTNSNSIKTNSDSLVTSNDLIKTNSDSLVTNSNILVSNSNERLTEKTAFNEQSTNSLHVKIAWNFHYNIHTDIIKQTTTGSGTITQADSMAILQTTAATSSSAKIETYDALRYIPGVGGVIRFTAVFTLGVAGSQQLVGFGDSIDGFFFGYNGATFSILKIRNSNKQWIAQNSWSDMNISGFDPTKGNVYQIKFQWLGFGEIKFFIEDRDTGKYELVHRLQYTNANIVPSIYNPSLPLLAEVINTTNNTNITIKTPSAMGGLEGEVSDSILTTLNGVSSTKTTVTTVIPILSIKNNTTFISKTNRTRLTLSSIGYSTDGTKSVVFIVHKNGTLTGPSFTDVNAAVTPLQIDSAATAISGSRILLRYIGGKIESGIIPGIRDISLAPGESLTITGESANATDLNISITVKTEL